VVGLSLFYPAMDAMALDVTVRVGEGAHIVMCACFMCR
jgi:hypothetical protein